MFLRWKETNTLLYSTSHPQKNLTLVLENRSLQKGHKGMKKQFQYLDWSGDSWMYPYQRTPMGNPYVSPMYWVFIGYSPQESLGNTINITGTLLGVHPIAPWTDHSALGKYIETRHVSLTLVAGCSHDTSTAWNITLDIIGVMLLLPTKTMHYYKGNPPKWVAF